MEVIALFDVLRRHVVLIVALTLVTTLAGYGLSFVSALIPERYDASATVLVRPHDPIKIDSNSSSKEYLDFPVAQTPVVESAAKTYIQIIQSPELVGEVVRELGLDHKPKAEGGFLKSFNDAVGPFIRDTLSTFQYGRVIAVDPFAKAVSDLSKNLVLKSYEDTYVFEIGASDDNPQRAADVANATARLFIKYMEKMQSSEGNDAAAHLKSELEQSRQRLIEARESVRKYKVEHGVFLYNPEYEGKLKVISDLTVELAKLDSTYANEKLGSGTIEAGTYAKKRDRLLKVLDENHADLTSLPTVERELQLREADADVANTTYATVAKELKDAELRGDAMPDARVISPSLAPQLPSRPRRGVITLTSLLAGLIVGAAIAFFLEYINRTARGIGDIEKFVGLKVIGTIPVASHSSRLRGY
jgi:uncharacterized protein involved in exopolysaccharide biosynthesis